jgi:hypothetical protein
MTTIVTGTHPFLIRTTTSLVVLIAAATLMLQCSETDEDKVLRDLELLSDGKSPTSFVGNLDFICFSFDSIKSEGCPPKLLSTKTAIIRLVRNNESKCVEINKFNFSIEPRSASCIPPNRLHVARLATDGESQKTSAPRFKISEAK